MNPIKNTKPKFVMKKFLRIIFGRTMIVFLFLLIQILFMFWLIRAIASNSDYYYITSGLLAFLATVYIINDKNTTSSYKIIWMLPILVMPLFGISLYFFVKLSLGTTAVNRRLLDLINRTKPILYSNPKTEDTLREIDEAEYSFAKYMKDYAFYPVYDNTSSEYFPQGEAKFKAILCELEKAEKFIFLEYFIIEEGVMWDSILKVLLRKMEQGVEIRCMYDGTCTVSHLPANYYKKLIQMGINCKIFSPIVPVLSTVQNNRDHRKILVIDGKVAFTGGINLSDEYINEVEKFGHWKDTGIMLCGEAVKSFTMMFLQNWNINEKIEDDFLKYVEIEDFVENSQKYNAKGYVIPYSDSPLDDEPVGKNVYLDILNRSRKYVHIMTPYLIIDEEMQNALEFAAKRGVDVRIILPHIFDKKYPYLLARTYYRDLIESGVKIYEYTPGFLHAKSFVCDDERAVVGSINLDYRSLYLHFECAAYVYKTSSILDIEKDFLETVEKSMPVTIDYCKKFSIINRSIGRILRIIAPLM